MPENMIRELSDFELDAVTGGQPDQVGLVTVGNVNVAIPVNASVDVIAQVLTSDSDATLDSATNQRGVTQSNRF
jgi:predicted nuclease of predicted toxin-antitoxin system